MVRRQALKRVAHPVDDLGRSRSSSPCRLWRPMMDSRCDQRGGHLRFPLFRLRIAGPAKDVPDQHRAEIWEQQLRKLLVEDLLRGMLTNSMAELVQDDVFLVHRTGPLVIDEVIHLVRRYPEATRTRRGVGRA